MTRVDQGLTQPREPAVSPDGTKIAFILNDRVHLIDLDGGNLTPLAPEDTKDSYPTWSPDGSQVAYRVYGRVELIPAAGGTPADLFDTFPEIRAEYVTFGGYQFSWR